jgi:hypothetical protein
LTLPQKQKRPKTYGFADKFIEKTFSLLNSLRKFEKLFTAEFIAKKTNNLLSLPPRVKTPKHFLGSGGVELMDSLTQRKSHYNYREDFALEKFEKVKIFCLSKMDKNHL